MYYTCLIWQLLPSVKKENWSSAYFCRISPGKRKYLAISLQCTYCFFTLWGRKFVLNELQRQISNLITHNNPYLIYYKSVGFLGNLGINHLFFSEQSPKITAVFLQKVIVSNCAYDSIELNEPFIIWLQFLIFKSLIFCS